MSGIYAMQAKALLMLLEQLFLALGAYLFLREFDETAGILAALIIAQPPAVFLLLLPQNVGLWRLTGSYLFISCAMFAGFKSKENSGFLPVLGLLAAGVALAQGTQIIFVIGPILFALWCLKDKPLPIKRLAIACCMFLGIFLLELYVLGPSYLPGGFYSNYGLSTGSGVLGGLFSNPSASEQVASTLVGLRFVGLSTPWLLAILLLPTAIILLRLNNLRSKSLEAFTLFMIPPAIFSLGFFGWFQVYQIEARWPLVLLALTGIAAFCGAVYTIFKPKYQEFSYAIPVAALIAILLLGGGNLLHSPSYNPPVTAMNPAFYSVATDIASVVPQNATLLSTTEVLQGWFGFIGRKGGWITSANTTQLETMQGFNVQNLCFVGINRNGFSFTYDYCPPPEQDACSYDYVVWPNVNLGAGYAQFTTLLSNRSVSSQQLPDGTMVYKMNKAGCPLQ
jgi:hypothetical protein